MPIGPSPFSANYETFKATYKKPTKKQVTDNWTKTGWHSSTKPKMRKLTESTMGHQYNVPDNEYDDFMQFTATQSELSAEYANKARAKNISTPADYIDWAFDKHEASVVEADGCGYIAKLTYSPKYCLLKVLFANNNSECVYFRVPAELAETLMLLARDKSTRVGADGKEHYLLGIYFWDLIRIRGTLHGSRYAFEYTVDNNTYESPNGAEPGPRTKAYELRYEKQPLSKLTHTDGKYDPDKYERNKQVYKDAKQALENGDYDTFHRIMVDNIGIPSEHYYKVDKSDANEDTLAAINANVKAMTEYGDTPLGNASARDFDKLKADMDKRARAMNKSNQQTYNKLGQIKDGETAVDAALRQEQYLIKYGLWGDYVDLEDLADEYGE